MKKCDNWTVQMNIDLDERLQKERVEGRILKRKNWFFFDYPNGNFVLKIGLVDYYYYYFILFYFI